METLQQKIASKQATVAVVGLGYIGLPTAVLFADAGFRVRGVDTDKGRINAINAGVWPLDPNEPELPTILTRVSDGGALTASPVYDGADVAIICVPTPVREDGFDQRALYDALMVVSSYPPGLLIVESTIPPGTMADVAGIFPRSHVAHCPERVSPMELCEKLRTFPRVVGGVTPEATALAVTLYGHICTGALYPANADTAALTKLAENAYQGVRIAFANELALICDEVGVDAWQVRELVNTIQTVRGIARPGPGVGGPCIQKDTRLLASVIGGQLLEAALDTNVSMADYTAYLAVSAMDAAGVPPTGRVVAVLGMTYKENVADTRDSVTGDVVAAMHRMGVSECVFHDPHVEGLENNLQERLRRVDAALLLVAHDEYLGLDWDKLGNVMRYRVLVDTRGVIDPPPEGFTFRGLGRGR